MILIYRSKEVQGISCREREREKERGSDPAKLNLIGKFTVTFERPKIVERNFTQLKLKYYLITQKKRKDLTIIEGE